MGPCPRRQYVADVPGELRDFMDLVEAHYGKRPVIYVTSQFNRVYLNGDFENEISWVASLFRPPSIRRQNWLFWQFHHRGRRPGIRGPVDLNAFRGSMSDLAALTLAELANRAGVALVAWQTRLFFRFRKHTCLPASAQCHDGISVPQTDI